MPDAPVVLRADDPRIAELQSHGWSVTARSWAAQLSAAAADAGHLRRLVDRASDLGRVREIVESDLQAVLELDRATLDDYPGGIATRHPALTEDRAYPTLRRRSFGVLDASGTALAVTYVDIDGDRAETDFTVVARDHRGRGLGAAVKAASVLALLDHGVRTFRTGGSADNPASLAVNATVGYIVDEHWVTLERTQGGPAADSSAAWTRAERNQSANASPSPTP